MCVETLTGVLFWSSDLLGKPFRAACFPFETLSGLLGVFLCGWQPADSQAGRPAEDSVVIPSVVVFTSEVLT